MNVNIGGYMGERLCLMYSCETLQRKTVVLKDGLIAKTRGFNKSSSNVKNYSHCTSPLQCSWLEQMRLIQAT